MNDLQTLQSMGLTLPTPGYIFGSLLFSILGYVAYRYGKKKSLPVPKWLGVALMFYPYFIDTTWLLYACGVVLCAAVYLYRE